jgi:hypothetical protein
VAPDDRHAWALRSSAKIREHQQNPGQFLVRTEFSGGHVEESGLVCLMVLPTQRFY